MPIVKFTDKLGDFLEKNNIYFTHDKHRRIKADDPFRFSLDLKIEPYCVFGFGHTINTMGLCSYSRSRLTPHTGVGRYSSIATNLKVMGVQHPLERFTTSPIGYTLGSGNICVPLAAGVVEGNFQAIPCREKSTRITIGNDVWIGDNVTLKQGITIGDGAVVGTGAIVTKDVPSYAVVAGVPAKILYYRFRDSIIEDLLDLKWWDYCYWTFDGIKATDGVEYFIDQVRELKAKNKLKKASDLGFVTGAEIQMQLQKQ